MFSGYICLFYNVFYTLEDANYLDPSSEKGLFSLHYVFISRILHQLDTFCDMYKLRTEGNMSPYQLWIQGMSVLNTDPHCC